MIMIIIIIGIASIFSIIVTKALKDRRSNYGS